MLLYRPVGLEELRAVYDSGMNAFPPRFASQPIFYPVLNEAYAVEIARKWNTKEGSLAGYVTRFSCDPDFVAQFPVQTVGNATHQELWIPAEQLEAFNRHITGRIGVSRSFFGDGFKGMIPDKFGFRGKDAEAQFVELAGASEFGGVDLEREIALNHTAVFLHYPFWCLHDFSEHGIPMIKRDEVLGAIAGLWQRGFPEIDLPKV